MNTDIKIRVYLCASVVKTLNDIGHPLATETPLWLCAGQFFTSYIFPPVKMKGFIIAHRH